MVIFFNLAHACVRDSIAVKSIIFSPLPHYFVQTLRKKLEELKIVLETFLEVSKPSSRIIRRLREFHRNRQLKYIKLNNIQRACLILKMNDHYLLLSSISWGCKWILNFPRLIILVVEC